MRIRVALAAVPLLALSLAACDAGADSQPSAAPAPERRAVPAEVKAVRSSFGEILADQANRTLYAFVKDSGGTSVCAADCLATWPALTAEKPTAGTGADAALLRTVTATSGTKQARYGDWPLYYYAGDVAPGDINGQGVDGEWFVVKPNGKLIKITA